MFSPYYRAYRNLKVFAVELDMEKYYDVYEISRTDMEDAKLVANVETSDLETTDTLQDLKIGLQRLHVVRKLLLCTLLALNADGSNLDLQRWSSASEMMAGVTSMTMKMTASIDDIMGEEEGEIAGRSYSNVDSEKRLRISDASHAKTPLYPWQRAYAKSNTSIWELVSRYPSATSEDAFAPG